MSHPIYVTYSCRRTTKISHVFHYLLLSPIYFLFSYFQHSSSQYVQATTTNVNKHSIFVFTSTITSLIIFINIFKMFFHTKEKKLAPFWFGLKSCYVQIFICFLISIFNYIFIDDSIIYFPRLFLFLLPYPHFVAVK